MEYNTDWKAIQQRFLPCKSKHQVIFLLHCEHNIFWLVFLVANAFHYSIPSANE